MEVGTLTRWSKRVSELMRSHLVRILHSFQHNPMVTISRLLPQEMYETTLTCSRPLKMPKMARVFAHELPWHSEFQTTWHEIEACAQWGELE